MQSRSLNRRQIRWAEFLCDFSFHIVYRPGAKNARADALSRRPDYHTPNISTSATMLPSYFLLVASRPTFLGLADFHDRTREACDQDPYFIDNKANLGEDFKLHNGLLYFHDRMYVLEASSLREIVLFISHDSPLAGHYGRQYWPDMSKDVIDYVSSCNVCQRAKPSRARPAGQLFPLPIPETPWQDISMDFITKLPVSGPYDAILVVVDRYSKQSHFIPCTEKVTSHDLINILFKEVFRLHGFPRSITTDRGPVFTSSFTAEIYRVLKISRNLSSAFHPETDGQTERLNSVLEQYVRCFISDSQLEWPRLLPFAEMAYNNAPQSALKTSPFFVNFGFHPNINIIQNATSNPMANNHMSTLITLRPLIAENLKKAQENAQKYANLKRGNTPLFAIGSYVLLSTKNLKLSLPTRKFTSKFVGPFQVVEKVNNVCYRLQLPASWKIHDAFHVSLLKKYLSRHTEDAPPTVVPEPENSYEVAALIDSRVKDGVVEYLFDWRGYGPSERTWQKIDSVTELRPLLEAFHTSKPSKPRDDRF